MNLGENKSGLSSKEHVGKWSVATITGEPGQTTFTSKKGKAFQKYSLPILVDGVLKAELTSLLRSDLNRLVDAYGTEASLWIGKQVAFTAVDDGNFANWQLYATIPVIEETVK